MSKLFTQWKSVPNLLSAMRILMIPFFIWSYLSADDTGGHLLSSIILIASGLTDLLDGYIARHFHMITDLGKILDPVADKLTQLAILICLTLRFPIFLLLFAVFAVKELLMLTGGVLLLKRGIHPGGAKWFGKLATGFFYVSTIVIVLLPWPNPTLVNIAVAVNTVLLVFALAKYIPIFFTLKREDGGSR